MTTFETSRLVLKPAHLEDADFFVELYNMPSFLQYIGDKNIRTTQDAEDYISEKFLPHFQKLGFGNYVVILKENQTKIGAVGIFERDFLPVMDIGFSFFEKYQGKGYAFEAAHHLKEIVAKDFGITKIAAMTTKDNFLSQKLIEKLGLRFQKLIEIPNDAEELMYYEN
ncbi:GNAT family N-acetyltransferase [Flavobacterium sp. NST-5]|uniref:GNAT family N-acetyltransferase n=1 Tax=Flavobacterium ichthyis TaxID=2698827 RepID=A0ABW9Z822_9FLAO|nr:GNAT family N-acetyltransferase [Flavobacterium ichthyis]NBL65020.1 GNAT family N-acetyltransferase [Flavobacterium ichthyis]